MSNLVQTCTPTAKIRAKPAQVILKINGMPVGNVKCKMK